MMTEDAKYDREPVRHQAEKMPLLAFVNSDVEEGEIQTIAVTPYEASYVLSHRNSCNRHLRTTNAQALARDMRADKWVLNGQTLKFSRAGELLDGQHRLTALEMLADMPEGFTVRFSVAAGLASTARNTVDINIKRTAGDILRLNNVENSWAVAAVSRKIDPWERGDFRFQRRELQMTMPELLEFVEARPLIHRSAEIAKYVRNHNRDIPPSLVGLAHYLFTQIDEDLSATFFQRLADGADLSAGQPVHTLRESLRASWRGKATRLPADEHMALLIRTWNATRRGKTLDRVIGMRADGRMPMPE